MDETIRTFVSPKIFFDTLQNNNINFFTGVPDSLLKDVCHYITSNTTDDNHIIAANEGNALGIATGYNLATNKIPLVYLQNSGFGNIINPLTSLIHHNVYNVPVLFLIGWRGEPGKKDEPQHKAMGNIMEDLIKVLKIEYSILPDYNQGAIELIKKATTYMNKTKKPYIFLVKKQTFEKQNIINISNNHGFTREKLLGFILNNIPQSDLIVSTTGMLSRELYEYRQNNNEELRDFLCVGSMGHCSSIGLGLSKFTNKNVYVLDGDGSMLMHMGALCINSNFSKCNFKHILINNGAHDSVGGQNTVGFNVDFNKIALGSGYDILLCEDVNNEAEINKTLQKFINSKGPVFLELFCNKGARSDLGRPPSSLENKVMFVNHVNN